MLWEQREQRESRSEQQFLRASRPRLSGLALAAVTGLSFLLDLKTVVGSASYYGDSNVGGDFDSTVRLPIGPC